MLLYFTIRHRSERQRRVVIDFIKWRPEFFIAISQFADCAKDNSACNERVIVSDKIPLSLIKYTRALVRFDAQFKAVSSPIDEYIHIRLRFRVRGQGSKNDPHFTVKADKRTPRGYQRVKLRNSTRGINLMPRHHPTRFTGVRECSGPVWQTTLYAICM